MTSKSLFNFIKNFGFKICAGYALSIVERISELRKFHGDRYDYSKFQKEGYHNSKKKSQLDVQLMPSLGRNIHRIKRVQVVENVRELNLEQVKRLQS